MPEMIKKYCEKCRKGTIQIKECNNTTGERILIGLITLGFNELMVEYFYECTDCGTINY